MFRREYIMDKPPYTKDKTGKEELNIESDKKYPWTNREATFHFGCELENLKDKQINERIYKIFEKKINKTYVPLKYSVNTKFLKVEPEVVLIELRKVLDDKYSPLALTRKEKENFIKMFDVLEQNGIEF